jgi:histidinol-phosphate aminotransferase
MMPPTLNPDRAMPEHSRTAPAPGPRLRAMFDALSPYATPAPGPAIDLPLDANEGPQPRIDLERLAAGLSPDVLRRYQAPRDLEAQLAEALNTDPANVVVTGGGDDAIDRICRISLEPGRELIYPEPSFEMIARLASLAGAEVRTVPWPGGDYPTGAVLERITSRTGLIAIVSPNNPTGAIATASDIERISAAAPDALLLVDLAYTEFADDDLTSAALSLPNAVVVRTFSKAYGLAGLRVGYAATSCPRIATALRAAGLPYPVSSLSLAVAADRLLTRAAFLPMTVATVRAERNSIASALRDLGLRVLPSQANFVLAFAETPARAQWIWRALASLGIGVRRFTTPALQCALRISCPCDPAACDRLIESLRVILRPEAVLFDMDGVLADVSTSYRRAIALTAQSYGVAITPADIADAKSRPGSNNDWQLTRRLLAERGVDASLDEVTRRFEQLYLGTAGEPGLEATERLIPCRALLERLAARYRLGIVTGRPRRDCARFLARFDLADLFETAVCMEDAPLKPDPAPMRLALSRLGCRRAWLIGDTPDDLLAARAADIVPIGIPAPGEQLSTSAAVLTATGAAATLDTLLELENLL